MNDEETIRAGMLQWGPGSLTRAQLDTLLMDALSDLWADTYRNGRTEAQRWEEFRSRVEARIADATGKTAQVR